MRRLRPVAWSALALVTVSGVLLLIAYPAKALTNPVFYLKLGAVAAALVVGRLLASGVLQQPEHDAGPVPRRARVLAVLSLVLWVGAITAGRFLAYTYNMMMAPRPY